MAMADYAFRIMCKDILLCGTSSKGQNVRAKWEDGTPAHTLHIFGVTNRYYMNEEFPILTIRPIDYKKAFDEILWIYQKKSNNIHDLHSHIWDEWADETGSIGTAYGYQVAKKHIHTKIEERYLKEMLDDLADPNSDYRKKFPSIELDEEGNLKLDQMDGVLWDLTYNPFSRRIITNLYNLDDLHTMGLYPCAYSMTFNVTLNEDNKMVLNMILNQRSQDTLVANGWNVTQYALLLSVIAHCCNMLPGQFIHVISDCHIYDRHVPIINELLERDPVDDPVPTLKINKDKKNFYDFTVDDIEILNYNPHPQIKNIPVAI